MKQRGIKVKDIANDLSVSQAAVSMNIHGHKRSTSRRISQAVADAIGKPLEEVFPKYKHDKEAA